jgi:hypothetical protein
MTVDDIVGFYLYCVDNHEFGGMLNMHNYNEPLATPDRIIEIMRRLPDAKFSIWTNGVLLATTPESIFERCVEVMVTLYPQTDMRTLNILRQKYPQIRTQPAMLDDRRREDIKPRYSSEMSRCYRPDFDLVIDYYGNGHMCCSDWRGEMPLGNIKIDSYANFIERWKRLRNFLTKPITAFSYHNLPRVCQKCFVRTPFIPKVTT